MLNVPPFASSCSTRSLCFFLRSVDASMSRNSWPLAQLVKWPVSMDLIWSLLSKVWIAIILTVHYVCACWIGPASAVFTFNFHRKTLSRSTPIKNEAISLGNDLHKWLSLRFIIAFVLYKTLRQGFKVGWLLGCANFFETFAKVVGTNFTEFLQWYWCKLERPNMMP